MRLPLRIQYLKFIKSTIPHVYILGFLAKMIS